jgi:anti-anti-sigma factor
MLKITQSECSHMAITLRLEGQVAGRWVDVLRRACMEVIARNGRRLVLDLADVTFIDVSGTALFRELAEHEVRVTNCSLFAAEQLKSISGGREVEL